MFEGPEKKLQVSVRGRSLRALSPGFWREVVGLAQASILSTIDNEHCTAHLLSESSLFIYDDRVIMITCGQTTLVESALHILEAIPDEDLELIIYERKSEYYPHLQPSTFRDDLARLESKVGGQHHRVGNHQGNFIELFVSDHSAASPAHGNDQTLELLMHGIRPSVAACFVQNAPATDSRAQLISQLQGILPNFRVDEYLFEPCGYSLNALHAGDYFTFHVTPEDAHSYVSFETNYPFADHEELDRLITEVVGFFAPSRLDILHFVPERSAKSWGSPAGLHHSPMPHFDDNTIVCSHALRLSTDYQLRAALFERRVDKAES